MCLGEYELSKVHILFIQRFCGGNIFSFVKSGMVLILLKHLSCFKPFLCAYSACHQLSVMKCDTVSSLLVPDERVKLTVESFCLPDPSSKESAPNGWFSYLLQRIFGV